MTDTMIARSFWAAEPIRSIPFLAALREHVLERSHTRLPKWKFRLGDDLVVQLQPKPAERRDRFFLFLGHALQGGGITAASFQSHRDAPGLYGLRFGVAQSGAAWLIKPTSARWQPRDTDCEARLWAFRARVVNELGSDPFHDLTPGMMVSPACLYCGKPLTDPASIARWIGPECFGSASLSVPRVTVLGPAGGGS